MSKIIPRLCIFFVGLPAVLLFVFLNYYNHLPLHLLGLAATALAANEAYSLMSSCHELLPRPLVVGCCLLMPAAAGVHSVLPALTGNALPVGQEVITYALIAAFLVLMAAEVLTARDFEGSALRLAGSSFVILYAGYLLTFVPRMTTFTKDGKDASTAAIVVFLLMVFLCDSLAWLFGMLLGKSNRGIIKASPNKSVAGFIGGFAGALAAGWLGWLIWPQIFTGSVAKLLGTGLAVAFAAITGDLAESVLKRSAGCKDSGAVIPGRGGMLDSIDSVVMSAPVYYLLLNMLFGPFA